ncbi:hypothetical protein L1987_02419 [Smallanthus sonchifolius]|uniref:Uncharacterized protein n=1 Tax=Smallanthus sonchifolius TaxID=185202 RepID=A0ACB9K7X6_9ASTR|nr:hypothetical protein L1987_02419 [Smallanthus sonchifolius]
MSAVRDFPPGCGPTWLRDQPLASAKRALFLEGPGNESGHGEEETEDTSDAPDVDGVLWEVMSMKPTGGAVRVDDEGVTWALDRR